MVQWGEPIFFSLGIHTAFRHPLSWDFRIKYIDIHLVCLIITIGNQGETYEEYKAWWASRSLGAVEH